MKHQLNVKALKLALPISGFGLSIVIASGDGWMFRAAGVLLLFANSFEAAKAFIRLTNQHKEVDAQ